VDSTSDRGHSTPEAVSAGPAAEEEAAPQPEVHKETPSRKTQATHGSIQAAIEQVNEIISALKDTLEQMDEVLESLEYFERQGNADEREIESLRRSLRQLQRPRESSHHSHRGQ